MWGIVYAMAPSAQGGGGQQSPWSTFIMLGIIFLIFYLLLIRPQQKRQKQHREMIANLKKGDMVITAGGLIGRITGLTDSVVTLEVADKVKVKVVRSQISGLTSMPITFESTGKTQRRRAKKEESGKRDKGE